MHFFLNIKSWQLFLVLFGPLLSAPLVESVLRNPFAAMAINSFVFWVLYFGWLWSVSVAANQKLDPSLRKSTTWITVGMAYAGAYMLGAIVFLPNASAEDRGLPGFVIFLHLLAMFAMFYAFAFTARRLVTLERNQRVAFLDYSGPFFLFWFFPIGVWFIQPRVNKLLGNTSA